VVNYRPRITIFSLLALMLVSVPDEATHALRMWMVAACLVWPHLAYWIGRGGSSETERSNIIVDCVLGGAVAGAFALRLWPTTAAFAVGCMNALLYGGFRFLAIGLPAGILGLIAVMLAFNLEPHWDTEQAATALSIIVIFAHVALLGSTAYRVRQRHRQARGALETEERKSQTLLSNVFPEAVIPRLRAGENPIADQFADVTVVFADIVEFTPLAERLGPKRTVLLLNELFGKFDQAAAGLHIEKIETTGDGYLAVGGAPQPLDDHAQAVADFALAILQAALSTQAPDGEQVQIRVGIHTGPVFAGVIGESRFHYKVFGETVNTASRIQAHSRPGRVLVSEATYKRVQRTHLLEEHGMMDLKGHGPMHTYWLLARSGRKNLQNAA
jgi:class 3 adenylate cyclase